MSLSRPVPALLDPSGASCVNARCRHRWAVATRRAFRRQAERDDHRGRIVAMRRQKAERRPQRAVIVPIFAQVVLGDRTFGRLAAVRLSRLL
jgi:hypothetical protein